MSGIPLSRIVATNLRALCQRDGSIGAICRATKINRQQFHKYLAGQSVPNATTRKRICRYFKIDESELFRQRAPDATPATAVTTSVTRRALETLAALEREPPATIAPGHYYADFAHPHDPSSLMRSLIIVRQDGNLTTFKRLTGFHEPKRSWWSHFHGNHNGVVLERRQSVYFVGLNSMANREPTMLVAHWIPDSEPMLAGHATILTPTGPTVTGFVITAAPKSVSLRTALRNAHVYSIEDPAVDAFVLEMLEQQCRKLLAMVRRLDLSVKPAVRRRLTPLPHPLP